MLPHEVPEDAYFLVVVLVEVEAVPVALFDLEEVVIQALLGDAYFLGGFLERVLFVLE